MSLLQLAAPFLTVIPLVFASLMLIPLESSASSQSTEPRFFPVKSSPYGTPFQEWTQKWWQWYLSVPKQNNHNFEAVSGYVPKECSFLQNASSPVFFVPYVLREKGVQATASCEIPPNKAVMVGIDNGLMDYGDSRVEEPKTVEKITEMVKKSNEFPVEFDVTLDGKPINLTNEEKDRVTSAPFYIVLPENNIWNEAPNTPYTAVADGWYLLLEPLSPGKHVLDYTTGYKVQPSPVGPANPEGYTQEVTYNLLVGE